MDLELVESNKGANISPPVRNRKICINSNILYLLQLEVTKRYQLLTYGTKP